MIDLWSLYKFCVQFNLEPPCDQSVSHIMKVIYRLLQVKYESGRISGGASTDFVIVLLRG